MALRPLGSHGRGLLDAVEADAAGGGGDGHGPGHPHPQGVVVLPTVPPLPHGGAHLPRTMSLERDPTCVHVCVGVCVDDGWFMQPHPARGRLIGGWGGCLNQQSSTHTPTQTLLSKETYRPRSKNHQRMLNWKCYIQVSKTQLDKVQRSKSKTKS